MALVVVAMLPLGGPAEAAEGSPAPFVSWEAMADRFYADLTAETPTTTQEMETVLQLAVGLQTPGGLVASFRGSADHRNSVDPVVRLYRAFFLRIPDQPGLEYWIDRRRSGSWSLNRIAQSFAGSSEFSSRYGTRSNEDFVKLIYDNVLGRPYDQPGLSFWTGELDTGRRTRGAVMTGFSESSEYRNKQAAAVHVSVLWHFMLGRAPSQSEYSAAVATLVSGTPVATIAGQIIQSPEYATRIRTVPARGWSVLSDAGTSDTLKSVSCWSANGCIAVGERGSGSSSRAYTERWNGVSWTSLTTPSPSSGYPELLDVSCWAADACVAVGRTDAGAYALRWNGTSWRIQSLPPTSSAGGVSCWSASGCVAVGGLVGLPGPPYVARWNGVSWKLDSTPTPAGGGFLGEVSCLSATQCMAVGGVNGPAGTTKTLALDWNGSTWRLRSTPTPSGGGFFYDVSCWARTGCAAVANASGYGGGTMSAFWNGSTWSQRRTVPTTNPSGLWGIDCASSSSCIAVGTVPFRDEGLTERWDGGSWTRQPDPGPLWDVSCWSPGNCIAVGNNLRARYYSPAG